MIILFESNNFLTFSLREIQLPPLAELQAANAVASGQIHAADRPNQHASAPRVASQEKSTGKGQQSTQRVGEEEVGGSTSKAKETTRLCRKGEHHDYCYVRTSDFIVTTMPWRMLGASDADSDKDYQPPKRARRASESSVDSFALDEDGHELMSPAATRKRKRQVGSESEAAERKSTSRKSKTAAKDGAPAGGKKNLKKASGTKKKVNLTDLKMTCGE